MEKNLQSYYRECLDFALPPIYSTNNYNILDLWHTILDNHPIKRSLYPKLHIDLLLYLITVLITMCFLSAVIFDHFVFFFGSSLSCNKRTSIFDCASSKDDITCFWNAEKLLCTSKYSDVDADNLIWISLFLLLLSLPVSYIMWYCNLYFIKLFATPYDEITKSKVVIVSEKTLNNPNSSANRKISFEQNVLTSVVQQEYHIFKTRLERYLNCDQTFTSVWSKVLFDSPFFNPSLVDTEAGQRSTLDSELIQQRKFSIGILDIKQMLSFSLLKTQSEIKNQIALESRILRVSRNSTVNPHDSGLSQRPIHFISDHFTSATPDASRRVAQTNRAHIDRFRTSRHLYLFLRDLLPLDARYLLDFQVSIRSIFTSIFSDPETEFCDSLHLNHKEWKLRVRVKFGLAFSYCALLIFMLCYFFLFVATSIVQNRRQKLSAVMSSLGLWIIFAGAIIQPLMTIISQYAIPRMISRDIHAARRCCLKTLKDHYFHQRVKDSFEREIRSLTGFDPAIISPKTPIEFHGQLLFSSQRYGLEYSESYEASLIDKYHPLSSLSYPLLHLYLSQPYTNDMSRLLLDVEEVELGDQIQGSIASPLTAYWLSRRLSSPSEPPQEKVDDDATSPNIPISAAESQQDQESSRNFLRSKRIAREKGIIRALEANQHLSNIRTLRCLISYMIRSSLNFTKTVSPSAANFYTSLVSCWSIYLFLQFLLFIFLASLVQLHIVLYFLHPVLALAPLVLLGWGIVVYYCILRTAYRTTQERRRTCHCTDREGVNNITLSVLLQCGCQDCRYCKSFESGVECDYCQIRPTKPIIFDPSILTQILNNFLEIHQVMSSPTPKQLLSLSSRVDWTPSRETDALKSDSKSDDSIDDKPEFIPSPSDQYPSPHDRSRYSGDDNSSLESSEEFDSNIVIRVPGRKDLNLSSKDDLDLRKEIEEWSKENHNGWNNSNIPAPPIPTSRHSLQEPIIYRSSTESDHLSGTVSPTMLSLSYDENYDPDGQLRSASTSFDIPLSETVKNPSIESYLKALEVRESFQSERMSLYQDMILQKTAAKLNLKNRRATKSRGGDGDDDGLGLDDRPEDLPRTASRGSGSESTLNTLKNRLLKSPLNPHDSSAPSTPKERISSAHSSSPRRIIDETKESLVKTRVVKSDFENHVTHLHQSMEQNKSRSQELLAKRLQQKKGFQTETTSNSNFNERHADEEDDKDSC